MVLSRQQSWRGAGEGARCTGDEEGSVCCEYGTALPYEKRREEEWERTKPGTAGRTRDQAGEKGAAGRARAICSANGDLGNEPAQLRQDGVGQGG